MKRNAQTGKFVPKQQAPRRDTSWLDALTDDELDVFEQHMTKVAEFERRDPSLTMTEDEGAAYLSALYIVHWMTRSVMMRGGHPACHCEACSEVDEALAEKYLEADHARAEMRLHREEERERRSKERAPRPAPIVIAPQPKDDDGIDFEQEDL